MINKHHFYILASMNIILIVMVLCLFINPPQQHIIAQILETTTNTTILEPTESTSIIETIENIPTTETIIETQLQTETILVETAAHIEKIKAPRYAFTDGDIYLMAQLLCGSQNISGDGEYDFVWNNAYIKNYYIEMSKVLCIVMNRQRNSQFPNTIKEVILQKGQFTPIPKNLYKVPSALAVEEIQRWCDAYNLYDPSVQVIPEDHLYCHSGPNNTTITRENWK